MTIKTPTLVRNELRMLFNQFVMTLKTPGLLAFYLVTLTGAFYVSSVVSTLVNFAPLFAPLFEVLEDSIDRTSIFAAVGIVTLASALGGYIGLGPTEVLESTDEYVMMPAPVQPHQLFLSRYIRRFMRKAAYLVIGTAIVFPLLQSAHVVALSLMVLILAVILFLETNYFIGGFCSVLRARVKARTNSRLRHILVVAIIAAVYLPTSPLLTWSPLVEFSFPSNVMSVILMEVSGVHDMGLTVMPLMAILLISFFIALLALANLTDYEMYEVFSVSLSREEEEGRFSRRVRGQVDFSASRFKDPMMWIVLKDFWSKMRTPLQFWKYAYVFVGILFGLYLNLVQPPWLAPVTVPPQFAYSLTPAFLLVLILLTQMSTLASLLAFVDEKENIYLLRTSPFKSKDIVLAKYFLSVIEISLTSVPLYLFLLYFFRVEGSAFLIFLAAPMILIFSATGIMAGAYVPVFTNDPKNPPVPLAFSFPAINLVLGALVIWIASQFGATLEIMVVLPAFVLCIILLFLSLSVHALNSYK
jgi:hypothetical protein